MSSLKESRKALVTYSDSKRIITYSKGEEVQELRHHFLRVFSDVLSDDVAPANIKFQRYDPTFDDYEDLENDAELDENAKLKATVTHGYRMKPRFGMRFKPTRKWPVPNWLAEERHGLHVNTSEASRCFTKEDYREDNLEVASQLYHKPHPIKKDIHYRLWNLYSGGLFFKDPTNSTQVPVSGGLDTSDNTIQAKYAGMNQFHLVFNGNPDLYITAEDNGQDITLTQSPGKNAKFEPLYNWTYTLFRCTNKTDFANGVGMYLGSDNNKSLATLVQVNEDSFHPALYPDPRTLFIKTTD